MRLNLVSVKPGQAQVAVGGRGPGACDPRHTVGLGQPKASLPSGGVAERGPRFRIRVVASSRRGRSPGASRPIAGSGSLQVPPRRKKRRVVDGGVPQRDLAHGGISLARLGAIGIMRPSGTQRRAGRTRWTRTLLLVLVFPAWLGASGFQQPVQRPVPLGLDCTCRFPPRIRSAVMSSRSDESSSSSRPCHGILRWRAPRATGRPKGSATDDNVARGSSGGWERGMSRRS